MIWFIRKWFWNLIAWIKFTLNQPLDIPAPPARRTPITPVPMSQAIAGLPIDNILTCSLDQIPPDERSRAKSAVYALQVWLYSAFSPMQAGLPPIDADPLQALKNACTWLHRSRFAAPVLPAEYHGSADLGSLAVRGPYAGYLERYQDGIFQWNVPGLDRYEHHPGLRKLGVRVLFRVDALRRGLQAYQIDSALGTSLLDDAQWQASKKLALCTLSTHTSLVRHFNWLHLAGGQSLGIATRNQLPGTHWLCRLLWPHTFATAQNGDMVTRGQVLRGGDFETTFSFSFEGLCALLSDSYRDYRIDSNDPEAEARRRQIVGQGFDTPTEDNLQALFKVIHDHAQRSLRAAYPGVAEGALDAAVQADAPVLAWLDELNVLTPNGAGLTRANASAASLAQLIARCIYMASAQHELLGSHLWNYQLWVHRQPARIALDGKRESLDVYQRLVNANFNLNVHRRGLVFDFSYLAGDAAAQAAMQHFVADLNALQAGMSQQPWAAWKLYPLGLKASINA